MTTPTHPALELNVLEGQGRFGDLGGAYVPPPLVQPLHELAEAFDRAARDGAVSYTHLDVYKRQAVV